MIEAIRREAEETLDSLSDAFDQLCDKINDVATGNSSIGELDDYYKPLKKHAKTLNTLAKRYTKLLPEESS